MTAISTPELKQMQGSCVPNHVGCYALLSQIRALRNRLGDRALHDAIESVSRHDGQANGRKREGILVDLQHAEPLLQYPRGLRPKRNAPVLPALSVQLNHRW